MKKTRDFLLKVFLFAFILIAFAFNGSGLMGMAAILLALTFLLNNASFALQTLSKLPLSFKVLNLWLVWVFLSGVFVAKNMELFLSAFGSLFLLIATLNILYLILSYNFDLVKYVILAIFLSALIQYIGPLLGFQAVEFADKDRAYGLSSNPNSFGLKMVFGSMALLMYMLAIRKKKIFIWLLCLPFFFLFLNGILDSGSRKSLMALFVLMAGTLAISIVNYKKNINLVRTTLSVVLIGGILYSFAPIVLEGSVVQERIEMGQARGGVEGDIRYQMYQFALQLFYEHPFFGIGLDNYRVYFFTGQYSHSDYAESLSSFGLFGFILYQLFYIIPLILAYRLSKIVNDKRIRLFLLIAALVIVSVKIIGLGIILYTSPAAMIIMTVVIAYLSKIQKVNAKVG